MIKQQIDGHKNLNKQVLERIQQVLQDAKGGIELNIERKASGKKLCIKELSVNQTLLNHGVFNISLPANAKFDFKNPLIAIEQVLETSEFNFKLKNGEATNLVTTSMNKEILVIQSSTIHIRKIVINYHDDGYLRGIRLLSKKNEVVLEAGHFDYVEKEIFLQEGQRIVGIKSNQPSAEYARHCDLVLVVGWME